MKLLPCRKKRRFDTRRQAKYWSKKRKNATLKKKLRPYQCPDCGYWHLTGTSTKQTRNFYRNHPELGAKRDDSNDSNTDETGSN